MCLLQYCTPSAHAASLPTGAADNYSGVFRTITKDSPESCSSSSCSTSRDCPSSPGVDSHSHSHGASSVHSATNMGPTHGSSHTGARSAPQDLFHCSVTLEDEDGEGGGENMNGLSERLRASSSSSINNRLGRNFVRDSSLSGTTMVLSRSFEFDQAGASGSPGGFGTGIVSVCRPILCSCECLNCIKWPFR